MISALFLWKFLSFFSESLKHNMEIFEKFEKSDSKNRKFRTFWSGTINMPYLDSLIEIDLPTFFVIFREPCRTLSFSWNFWRSHQNLRNCSKKVFVLILVFWNVFQLHFFISSYHFSRIVKTRCGNFWETWKIDF